MPPKQSIRVDTNIRVGRHGTCANFYTPLFSGLDNRSKLLVCRDKYGLPDTGETMHTTLENKLRAFFSQDTQRIHPHFPRGKRKVYKTIVLKPFPFRKR